VNIISLRPSNKKIHAFLAAAGILGLVASLFSSLGGTVNAAACQTPTTDYGTVTTSVVTPEAATYRIWTRMQVPDTTNNTYLLEVDGTNCYNVGGGNITAGAWAWIAYKDGNVSSMIDLALTKGTHSLKLIGNKAGVKIDRLVFASDISCIPKSADGSECNVPSDTTVPTVQLTAPAANSTVTGTVNVTASATDNVGVTKVEFYVNGSLARTDTSSPYSYSWDTTQLPNESQLLGVAAYDAAGNVSRDSYRVNAQNGDRQAPTVPTSLTAAAPSYNKVNLSWKAATDDVAVTGYSIVRDGLPIAQVGTALAYTDNTVIANTSYSYQVYALDGAGNKSAASNTASVKTPIVPDTQAPTKPASLAATAQSTQQINLSWMASTDNTGVAGYNVYRSTGSDTVNAQKINSQPVQSTSYADPNLSADTTYSYYVKAVDGAGNASEASNTATAKTQAVAPPSQHGSTVSGTVKDRRKKALTQATETKIIVYSNGHRKIVSPTDNDGVYVVRGLSKGRYVLGFRSDGYRSKYYSVKVGTDQQITKNVVLQKR
jgi:fibronectin type 3 domain-containing protein